MGAYNIKRIAILILGEDSVEKAAIIILGADDINRIISGGSGLWGGSVAELGSGDVFLFLALCNILEDRVMKYGNRQR